MAGLVYSTCQRFIRADAERAFAALMADAAERVTRRFLQVECKNMSTLQLEYTADELLATDDVAAPLVAGGVRCHGGFLRRRHVRVARGPSTASRPSGRGRRAHRERFGTDVLDLPLDTWPGHYPNLDQTRFLLR